MWNRMIAISFSGMTTFIVLAWIATVAQGAVATQPNL